MRNHGKQCLNLMREIMENSICILVRNLCKQCLHLMRKFMESTICITVRNHGTQYLNLTREFTVQMYLYYSEKSWQIMLTFNERIYG